MKRIIPIIFILAALILVWIVFNRDRFSSQQEAELYNPKVIIPAVSAPANSASDITEVSPVNPEENQFLSYIPLNADETLIQSITVDFDGDGVDDQISAVKKSNNPCLFLIVGMYSIKRNSYYRAAEIKTEITQSKTFSFHLMDVIGDGANCLVYSGITGNNETVLEVLKPAVHKNGSFTLTSIANIKSEGTVFVEETYRSDAYAIGLTKGTSYPIWTYSFDPDAPPQSLDQIHTLYQWNSQTKKYEKVSAIKVPGKKIEAKAMSRILDGKIETFEEFLNGLWYKPSSGGNTQYVFFNSGEQEIIFLVNDTQEIYIWNSGILRRNGIYISATNKSVTTQRRKFDISLSALDEIKLKLSEDVQMKISADSSWDGIYRKMGSAAASSASEAASYENIISSLSGKQQNWISAGNTAITFTKDRYMISSGNGEQDSGMYAVIKTNSAPVIQFRSLNGGKKLQGYYSVALREELSKEQEKHSSLTLSPIDISIYGTEPRTGETFTFECTTAK